MSSPKPSATTDYERQRRARLWGDVAWFGFLAVLALLVIFVAGVSIAATRPAFCGLCHVAAHSSVSETRHADQRCDACHAGSNAFDLAASRLAVVRMISRQFLPGADATSTYVSNEVCARCHGPDLLQTTVSNGLRMNHRALIEARWSCTRCHATVGHGDRTPRKVGYSMDMCLPCHSTNPGNKDTCQTCHPGKTQSVDSRIYPTPHSATHGGGSTRNHGMGDLDTCKACHAPQQCMACHPLQMPHPNTFMGSHGADIVQGNLTRQTCSTCHQPASCDNCHGVPMPHREGFVQEHAKDLQGKSSEVCARCHTQQSCTNCHLAHIHPGIPSDLLKQLREHPVS